MKSSDPNVGDIRAAIAVELEVSGARSEGGSGETFFYLPTAPGQRLRLSADSAALETLDSDGSWRALEAVPYPEAWLAFHRGRVRRALRALSWTGLWVLLGVAMAIGFVVDLGSTGNVLLYAGSLVLGLVLWLGRLPFPDFYPGPFLMGLIVGATAFISRVGSGTWGVVYGMGVLVLAIWGWMHCGGPEFVRMISDHLSRDPRRVKVPGEDQAAGRPRAS